METKIFKDFEDGWILAIEGNGVRRWWYFISLIETIEMANILKVHVDNIDELPLNQYIPLSNRSAGGAE